MTDTDKNYRPGEYKREFGNFSLSFKFPVVKLLDYQGREEELLKDENVFSLLILAFLGAVEKGEAIDESPAKSKFFPCGDRRTCVMTVVTI